MKLWLLTALLVIALLAYGASGVMDGGNIPTQLWNMVVHLFGG
jgi:hypothetical protein